MVVQCCLCKKVRNGKQWVTADPVELTDVHVSHGYCPACAAQAFAEIRTLIGVKRMTSTVAVAP